MNDEKLMSTKEVSEYLGIAVSTLLLYRTMETGPAYIKMRRLVRYRKSEVDAWLEAQISPRIKYNSFAIIRWTYENCSGSLLMY